MKYCKLYISLNKYIVVVVVVVVAAAAADDDDKYLFSLESLIFL